MKALNSPAIKALLKKKEGKPVALTAAQIGKHLEAKSKDDNLLVGLYCDNLVANGIILKSEDGKYFLGDKPVMMYRATGIFDPTIMALEEKQVDREEIDAHQKQGWTRGKLATKLAVKKEINERAKLLKDKLEEVFGPSAEEEAK